MFGNYVYKKEVDWSLLNQGLSIPLDIQIIFQKNIDNFIDRGESRNISLILEGTSYEVRLVNQNFDESKYINHKDIIQIRYSPNSKIADKLKQIFSSTYSYLYNLRNTLNKGERKRLRLPQEREEYLAIYTTEYKDTFLAECITNNDTAEAKKLLINEDEQSFEFSINYPESDPTASIETTQKLLKIRKLNRAIGDSLKMLYEYKCQICGNDFGGVYDAHIVESHHIDPFVASLNNDASNQIIICPNHHRVLHRAAPVFIKEELQFVYSNGKKDKLLLNKHI